MGNFFFQVLSFNFQLSVLTPLSFSGGIGQPRSPHQSLIHWTTACKETSGAPQWPHRHGLPLPGNTNFLGLLLSFILFLFTNEPVYLWNVYLGNALFHQWRWWNKALPILSLYCFQLSLCEKELANFYTTFHVFWNQGCSWYLVISENKYYR